MTAAARVLRLSVAAVAVCFVMAPVRARAAEPEEHDPYPTHIAIAAFTAADLADTVVTYHLLKQHRDLVHEANPLLRPLENRPALLVGVKTGAAVTTIWLVVHEHKRHPLATFWVAVGASAGYTAIAVRNARFNP